MAQVYFHCSSTQDVLIDRRGAVVDDLTEICNHATLVIHSLITAPGPEDWREWVLYVSDDDGEEIFCTPFSAVLGRLH
jgi:hypothetical protein